MMMMTDTNTSLYEDNIVTKMNNEAVKRKKSAMTLDFGISSAKRPKGKLGLLASPDLNMLKLASPELEKLIIQHNGMVTTTPTPGAPTPTQILFPKAVTEEQEAYARGFMDALAELHKQGPGEEAGAPPAPRATESAIKTTVTRPETTLVEQPRFTTLQTVPASIANQFTTTTTLPGGINGIIVGTPKLPERPSSGPGYENSVPATVIAHSPTPVAQAQYMDLSNQSANYSDYSEMHPRTIVLKEEPQTVPNGYTPPTSPIDMSEQEGMKCERKRARNRVAARKCRFRKLERISRLEMRVDELKGQNNNLSNDACELKEQVAKLKQQIMEHVKSGCQIMVSSGIGSML